MGIRPTDCSSRQRNVYAAHLAALWVSRRAALQPTHPLLAKHSHSVAGLCSSRRLTHQGRPRQGGRTRRDERLL